MEERIKMLRSLSKKSSTETYNRSLSDEEIELEKDRFTKDAMELDRQKAELKSTVERLKGGITSIENLMKERLERIKTGQMEITGVLWGVPDHSKQRMNFYDSFGEQINSRPMTPDERQGTLFIGDDPDAEPQPASDQITDVEFEEVQAPASLKDDPEYKEAVDELYGNEAELTTENVEIPVQEPTEDKPKKRSKGKKPATPESDDEAPI